ncbi:BREX-1 system adenine-specific DNA-methyltransferase PglX [Paraburkholderia sp. GAS82]|uniref:BREX-1 system adenine-specific DNA-methyltransferase PglX n=1 Tax=Paraburkholderia sp. GAS82 TaxID=3035137 RepID=UPI003D2503A3
MNTNNIKSYAPKARIAFIVAMTKRAALFGIRESSIPGMGVEPLEQKGDLALIGDRPFPASIIRPREALVKKVEQMGFAQVMEQAAYSWFNRLCAIRFMELKDYLDHGLRVLSHPEQQGSFQILDDCLDIDLPGLDKQRIAELKLDGNKDEELYRELLLAQCHALHQAMPFLFEAVDDATELLLPDNLTKTDSLIRELVNTIPEDDWANIEIIGWLYQFYISEKKDQVIGKVVKSEDIPAATQLFTPNWIVKYMVQNSLGAQWLATYPDSPLKAQMEYYIEPAEQTVKVKAQLAAITPSQLNPEALTLIDPASGSGHILVEAYDLFRAIYLERGYRQRDAAQLILEKNVFGLDIDVRAAQLTGFALMMKGRADDRRLFERKVKLNVMALMDSAGFDPEVLASGVTLADYGLQLDDLTELKRLFEHATTFGSLIQVPEELAKKIPGLKLLSEATSQDLFVADELKRLGALVQQAQLLGAKYDAVVANPPYMGSTGMNASVKEFVKDWYIDARSDLFACFIQRGCILASTTGRTAMVTMDSWMFLSSFTELRESLLREHHTESLVHVGWNCFPEVHTYHRGVAFVLRNDALELAGNYQNLSDVPATVNKNELFLARRRAKEAIYRKTTTEFEDIPGSPLAYWISDAMRAVFRDCKSLGEVAEAAVGLQTGDNGRFLRFWFEVSDLNIARGCGDRTEAIASQKRWFPSNKGGEFRKWYGNHEFVLDWQDDGRELRNFVPKSVIRNPHYYFHESVSWSDVTSGLSSFRVFPQGFIHDAVGHSAFGGDEDWKLRLVAYCNTKFFGLAADLINPTIHFHIGYFNKLPFAVYGDEHHLRALGDACVSASKVDWNAYERSWDFQSLPILTASSELAPTLESSYNSWISENRDTIAEMKRLEEENNRLFIDAYNLVGEVTPDVPIEQITLTVNPAYRYGGKLSEAELWTRFREDTCAELVSYAVGCMLGRYSLDEPGLIYAHGGNHGFDPSRYTIYPADADGILPLTDKEWFADDAANRLIEFVSVAWDKTHLEANLRFLTDNLSPKKTESSRETLRRYLCENFFKDHLRSYKKRPIYWLFSSGKQKAFQCLVYLHRYNEGTLARMRTEYVIPLTAKLNTYANKLERDIDASTSTAEKKALEKQLASLHSQQAEIATFDEKLRHYADQRISLDLDDGVKINYGKFGDLLAEVNAIRGEKSSD